MDRAEAKLTDGNGNSVPYNAPGKAPQKGSQATIYMDNLGTDILKAVYRDGKLYVVGNDAQDWFAPKQFISSVRLVRLSVTTFPNIPTEGNPSYINRRFGKNGVGDQPNDQVYYGWPAIEVNKNKDMVIVYARSGMTLFPEVRYSTFFDKESDLRFSRLLQAGGAPYGPPCVGPGPCPVLRWGDTAGAAVDPADDTAIWVAQQFANAIGGWDIWVGKIFGN